MTVRQLATIALMVLAPTLSLTGCSSGSGDDAEATTTATQSTGQGEVALTDLTSVEQLRTLFDDDHGTARLLLLLSPT